MYKTISKSVFRDSFHRMGIQHHFSYEGLGALYDWLEESCSNDEKGYELDVIGLCCEFSENTFDEIKSDYSNKFDSNATNEEVLEALQDETSVVWSSDKRVLFCQF